MRQLKGWAQRSIADMSGIPEDPGRVGIGRYGKENLRRSDQIDQSSSTNRRPSKHEARTTDVIEATGQGRVS